jgi:hypothetical protein
MGNHSRPNHDRPVIYKPEEMKDPDEKEYGTRDDQVQLVAHLLPPICRLTLKLRGAAAYCQVLLERFVSLQPQYILQQHVI